MAEEMGEVGGERGGCVATEANGLRRRNFITKSYPTMKKHNPHTPIMIREASGVEPKVYARYGAFKPSLLFIITYIQSVGAAGDGPWQRQDVKLCVCVRQTLTNTTTDFGKEKMLPLKGAFDLGSLYGTVTDRSRL